MKLVISLCPSNSPSASRCAAAVRLRPAAEIVHGNLALLASRAFGPDLAPPLIGVAVLRTAARHPRVTPPGMEGQSEALKSIDPMWGWKNAGAGVASAPALIGLDEFRLAIPWWDALQQGPPPLHQPGAVCSTLSLPVEEFTANGDIS